MRGVRLGGARPAASAVPLATVTRHRAAAARPRRSAQSTVSVEENLFYRGFTGCVSCQAAERVTGRR